MYDFSQLALKQLATMRILIISSMDSFLSPALLFAFQKNGTGIPCCYLLFPWNIKEAYGCISKALNVLCKYFLGSSICQHLVDYLLIIAY